MSTTIVIPPVDSDNLKRCSKCGEHKPLEAFSKHACQADGLDSQCKVCQHEYYIANRDRIAERAREYRAANRERRAEYNRAYNAANAEHIIERTRAYRVANAERIREYQEANAERIAERKRKYYTANAEHVSEWGRKYRKANAERIAKKASERQRKYRKTPAGSAVSRAASHRRRARKLAVGGSYTPADIEAIRIAQGNHCYLCGKKLKGFHIDHFIPLSKGGTNDPGNLRLACPKCNLSKGGKHPHELGMLI
jgi:5-methylcytosine-specific restriction endonuclease McrA